MCDNCDVSEFHTQFGLPTSTADQPRDLPPELVEFRIKFMEEELQEFKDAYAAGDHAKMFDALIDLVYVAHGTSHIFGYPWHIGWSFVHAANMKKVRAQKDGSDSARGSAWDVVKPPGWVAPDITMVLQSIGWHVDYPTPEEIPDPIFKSSDLEIRPSDSRQG